MRNLVESLKRLYEKNFITQTYNEYLLDKGTINQLEYNYILSIPTDSTATSAQTQPTQN